MEKEKDDLSEKFKIDQHCSSYSHFKIIVILRHLIFLLLSIKITSGNLCQDHFPVFIK